MLSWAEQVEAKEATETQSKDDNVTPMVGTNPEVMVTASGGPEANVVKPPPVRGRRSGATASI